MPKVIRMVPDYDCESLWDVESADAIEPSELSLSPQLIQRIHAWESLYNATLVLDNPKNSGFANPEAEQNFIQEGLEIAQQLQIELGAEYQVIYQDQPVSISPLSPAPARLV